MSDVRLSAMDIVEGYYLGEVIAYLLRNWPGITSSAFVPVSGLANHLKADVAALSAVLAFVIQRSDFLERNADHEYRLATRYRAEPVALFRLEKFLGAYGPVFSELEDTLSGQQSAAARVNLKSLAAAFARIGDIRLSTIARFILDRGVTTVCEIGCGTAPVLRTMCTLDPRVNGWAIDPNPYMCMAAEDAVAKQGVSSRVSVRLGGVADVEQVMSESERVEVGAVIARSLLNEFFGSGPSNCISILRLLKQAFPKKLLVVSDYLGKLTYGDQIPGEYRYTVLQDVVQAVTGQGIPLPEVEEWRSMYRTAGLSLIHEENVTIEGADTFVHGVVLG